MSKAGPAAPKNNDHDLMFSFDEDINGNGWVDNPKPMAAVVVEKSVPAILGARPSVEATVQEPKVPHPAVKVTVGFNPSAPLVDDKGSNLSAT